MPQARAEDDGRDSAAARPSSALDGAPRSLPPLEAAFDVQRRASAVGFDWPDSDGALAKVREETSEVARLLPQGGRRRTRTAGDARLRAEIGDLLFAVINLARLARVDPARALTEATKTFEQRFRAVEQLARKRDYPMPGTELALLDQLWDEVKSREQTADCAAESAGAEGKS